MKWISQRSDVPPWGRFGAPPWWCSALEAQVVRIAEHALPKEVGGWFVEFPDQSQPTVLALPGAASPSHFQADGRAVVRMAYDVEAARGRVLGTFHSHPQGAARFSGADRDWLSWGQWHALLVMRPSGRWRIVWRRVRTGV
jgi:proteasome lid subunit RPN8/RPN11